MLQWTVIFIILILEVFACMLVLLPVPNVIRKWMLNIVSMILEHTAIRRTLATIYSIIAFFFIDAWRSVYKLQAEAEEHRGHEHNIFDNGRLLRNQRNGYITGFTLFLALCLWRFAAIMRELVRLESDSKVVSKQAKNQISEYGRLSDELDETRKERDEFKEKYESIQKEVKNIDALKKQAEAQRKEYMRLMEENEQLHDEVHKKALTEKKDD